MPLPGNRRKYKEHLFEVDPHKRRNHIYYRPTDEVFSVDEETYAMVASAQKQREPDVDEEDSEYNDLDLPSDPVQLRMMLIAAQGEVNELRDEMAGMVSREAHDKALTELETANRGIASRDKLITELHAQLEEATKPSGKDASK